MNGRIGVEASLIGQTFAHLGVDAGEALESVFELVRERHEHELGRGLLRLRAHARRRRRGHH